LILTKTLTPVAERQYAGNFAELRFPRSLIGNPDSLRLLFRGFNNAVGGTLIDNYPDGQNDRSSSEQFFKYEFTNGAYADGRPTASAQSLSTNSNSSLSLILSGDDPSANELSYTVSSNPQHGTLTGNAPNLTYTPDADYIGSDSFKFIVNNGSQDRRSQKTRLTGKTLRWLTAMTLCTCCTATVE